MIDIQGLTQHYRNKRILDDVSLQISEHEICALVGRNGAGKSTLIHTILGILPIQKGTVQIAGISSKQEGWKKRVAYLPEKFQLYPQLTGEENIRFFASLEDEAKEEKIEQCLRMVELWEARNEKIKGYSKGMLQRLGLGIMLYYPADILILDEPTSGLDPMGRTEILHILKSLKDKTILFSSHHMDEIKQICTHVAFLEEQKMTKYTIDEFNLQSLSQGVS
ncbi:ABC transporter ATP-binding protein [Ammoniphilus sp. CFH 90114]|uniref:ABC transporter ATP-binding protein n=1 Tax=Ammoniphilus sp. CFH 90114 TaxID=2493665 RepID=UPI00100DB434|nr:ABC transporter ATP-binding protein [Ammoniphilus sp. CFH 90114]RXT03789.1 ABC transporter ATP-binding protein [Ammoniphilus sp. CFH 90114]